MKDLEEIKLNCCALCGEKAILLQDDGCFGVRCQNNSCPQSEFPIYDSKEAAVEAWNESNPKRSGEE